MIRLITVAVDLNLLTLNGQCVDKNATAERYESTLRDKLCNAFPDVNVDFVWGSHSHGFVDCDTDSEYDDIRRVIGNHYQSGGFYVLRNGEVI